MLTFADLLRLDPRLQALLDEVRGLDRNGRGDFCGLAAFCGYPGYPRPSVKGGCDGGRSALRVGWGRVRRAAG
jgi:hypothetical protein